MRSLRMDRFVLQSYNQSQNILESPDRVRRWAGRHFCRYVVGIIHEDHEGHHGQCEGKDSLCQVPAIRMISLLNEEQVGLDNCLTDGRPLLVAVQRPGPVGQDDL